MNSDGIHSHVEPGGVTYDEAREKLDTLLQEGRGTAATAIPFTSS